MRGGTEESSARTAYFATSENPTGARCEFALPAREFGLIDDGDNGQLTHQGTRFKGFAHERRWPLSACPDRWRTLSPTGRAVIGRLTIRDECDAPGRAVRVG